MPQSVADQRKNPIRFWDTTPEQWNRFIAVNAAGPINLARAVLPHMLKANSGRIITVTTSLGTMVREGYLLYGSSKAAAESSMAVLAADLADTGVTSNILVPGGTTNTPLVGEARPRENVAARDHGGAAAVAAVGRGARGQRTRRFIAADWDTAATPAQAAERPARRSPG